MPVAQVAQRAQEARRRRHVAAVGLHGLQEDRRGVLGRRHVGEHEVLQVGEALERAVVRVAAIPQTTVAVGVGHLRHRAAADGAGLCGMAGERGRPGRLTVVGADERDHPAAPRGHGQQLAEAVVGVRPGSAEPCRSGSISGERIHRGAPPGRSSAAPGTCRAWWTTSGPALRGSPGGRRGGRSPSAAPRRPRSCRGTRCRPRPRHAHPRPARGRTGRSGSCARCPWPPPRGPATRASRSICVLPRCRPLSSHPGRVVPAGRCRPAGTT